MLDSTKKVLQLMDVGTTCRELNAICFGCEHTDLEQFTYFSSMREWLFSKHEFISSEAQILNNLQKEIWDKERIENEPNLENLRLKIAAYETENIAIESQKDTSLNEQIIYKPKRKEPFEKVIEFTLFGYKFFFLLEIDKKV